MNNTDKSKAKIAYEPPNIESLYFQESDIITESLGDENWGDEWDGRE